MRNLIRAILTLLPIAMFAAPVFASADDIQRELAQGRSDLLIGLFLIVVSGLAFTYLFIRYERKKIERVNLR